MTFFMIDAFPRTGSTTLARILDLHPLTSCMIEPFHPNRYNGEFHRISIDRGSIKPALALIHCRWNGFKHVWEARDGWPFKDSPTLNNELVVSSGKVLFLRRRNLLKRYISGYISSKLRFWIGTKSEFMARLEIADLPPLKPDKVRLELQVERLAIDQRLALLRESKVEFRVLEYEDLFDEKTSVEQQWGIIRDIFAFLKVNEQLDDLFVHEANKLLDPAHYQWASREVYSRIPGVDDLNRRVGDAEVGFLFE